MNNKEQIKKLRDNAELAWASYGYFDFINKQYSFDEKDKDKFKTLYAKINDLKKSDEKVQNAKATYTDILNMEYNSLFDGEFSPLQAKQFFERYDLLIHQPNTESSFSAALFYDTHKDGFVVWFRGIECGF
ncbi:hypothetical protein DFW92_05310 [Campylobacter coli]|uniref:Uncharacterized protein n=1 Tax=Campylobacter coli TaxID=195 RepID=A0A692HUS1_CAMCO|nr:hypothetical protein [Campylobacter coli]EAC1347875.1 hypothetical protein [Campylobacter coli]EAC2147373.1 hypothetical protein [Campylobacter coli]EAH4469668.1 hypothetical protein [Campylobacter coli]EAH4475065.1 hypothetical protein [Campylobacter coli]EAH4477579.1 hypothetical protein [Campylobacter coli]